MFFISSSHTIRQRFYTESLASSSDYLSDEELLEQQASRNQQLANQGQISQEQANSTTQRQSDAVHRESGSTNQTVEVQPNT